MSDGRGGTTRFSGLRVLVVEDSAQMSALLVALLDAMGIEDVLTAGDGASGLALYAEGVPDLIITDGAMQPMDGYEMTLRIRADAGGPNPSVPILMISAHAEESRARHAHDTGVTVYVAKPVTPEILYGAIETALDRTHS